MEPEVDVAGGGAREPGGAPKAPPAAHRRMRAGGAQASRGPRAPTFFPPPVPPQAAALGTAAATRAGAPVPRHTEGAAIYGMAHSADRRARRGRALRQTAAALAASFALAGGLVAWARGAAAAPGADVLARGVLGAQAAAAAAVLALPLALAPLVGADAPAVYAARHALASCALWLAYSIAVVEFGYADGGGAGGNAARAAGQAALVGAAAFGVYWRRAQAALGVGDLETEASRAAPHDTRAFDALMLLVAGALALPHADASALALPRGWLAAKLAAAAATAALVERRLLLGARAAVPRGARLRAHAFDFERKLLPAAWVLLANRYVLAAGAPLYAAVVWLNTLPAPPPRAPEDPPHAEQDNHSRLFDFGGAAPPPPASAAAGAADVDVEAGGAEGAFGAAPRRPRAGGSSPPAAAPPPAAPKAPSAVGRAEGALGASPPASSGGPPPKAPSAVSPAAPLPPPPALDALSPEQFQAYWVAARTRAPPPLAPKAPSARH